MLEEEKLEEYLCNRYKVAYIDNDVKERLRNAFDGELQVKPEHLLAEWKMMEQALNITRGKNLARGKDISGLRLLKQDLAIVLNNYERYVRYISAAEKQNLDIKDNADLLQMTRNAMSMRKNNDDLDDVRELVNELFFSEGR